MAFATKDGKQRFGSAFKAKRYDEFHAPSAEHEEKESPVFEAAEKEGQEEGHKESPEQVVAEHGPAHTTVTHHDHETGKHKVVSHHKDGHMHESEHASSDEAHDHAKGLAKADMEEAQNDQQGAASEEDGFEQGETA